MARRRFFTKKRRDALSRTWGYFLLPALFLFWTAHDPSYAPIAVVSLLAALFFLFQARVPCGALKADGETHCINNARGLLGGCNQVVAHKWYNAKMLVHRSSWGRFVRNACRKIKGAAAMLGALATCLSAFIAAGQLAVSTFTWLDPRVPK
jgi:hypothetical protein